jgi:hypothetical protein
VKRFSKTLALLIVSLFIVASGVDAALDHLSHSVTQNSFAIYNQEGRVVFACDGDLSMCKTPAKPSLAPRFLHRT